MAKQDNFSLATAAKIAWRESRASSVKFGFVILAVAVGVGSLTGVRGFSSAFYAMLLKEARTLMAADLSARVFVMATPEQLAVIDDLGRKGIRSTQVTETLTMAASLKDPSKPSAPVLVSAKAIDPTVYPFYGELQLTPAARLRDVLNENTVGVSDDLALRLNVTTGDMIRLGGQDYKVIGQVTKEPDKMSGSINIGPRLLMTRGGLERAGLLNAGSRAAQRFLFQLPIAQPSTATPPPDVEAVRQTLKNTFPEAQVIDFRETNPAITRGLETSTRFLSLVSLIALIVGALGVATAMHSHLQQKLDSIAVMKCLGARSSQIIRIYLLQTLALGLTGGLLGIAVGGAVQLAFPHLIARYFQVPPSFVWDWASMAQGLLVAVFSTLLFTLPPLLSVREIRPNLILRREMGETRGGWFRSRSAIAVSGGILVGMGALAAWIAGGKPEDALRLGAYFTGGLAVALGVLAGVASLLLRGLKMVVKIRTLPANWRHGMANLYRPGNQARAVLVALGLGVMFTVTIYLVQQSILSEIAASAPPGMPNVFLIDIQQAQKDGVTELVKQQPGLDKAPELIPSIAARVVKVNGQPVETMDLKGFQRRFRQSRNVSYVTEAPKQTQVVSGAWWTKSVAGLVAISDDAAKVLKVSPGTEIEFVSSGKTVLARVAVVYRNLAVGPGSNTEFLFTPESVAGLPTIYYSALRMQPSAVANLQQSLYQRFPTVSVINVADVIQTVQEVVDQIALVIRFISTFAIMAGVIILASSVAGTRFRRIREVVILKTLGATRKRVSRIFSAEFSILGATAGLMGSLLASGFANLVLVQFFKGEWKFNAPSILVAVVLTAVIANIAGWAASARILGQKPLEVLRAE